MADTTDVNFEERGDAIHSDRDHEANDFAKPEGTVAVVEETDK